MLTYLSPMLNHKRQDKKSLLFTTANNCLVPSKFAYIFDKGKAPFYKKLAYKYNR